MPAGMGPDRELLHRVLQTGEEEMVHAESRSSNGEDQQEVSHTGSEGNRKRG